MTQARVHRKDNSDNSARFKEMERWMDKNLTGEGVGVKASEGIETSPAKKRQVMKESQAKLVSPAKVRSGGGTLSAQASEPRRSRRRRGNPDKEVHSIPCRKGIKLMSEREANECSEHGEVLRWSTDSSEDEYPQLPFETEESEEPTEFGVVWERFVIRETENVNGGLPTTESVITTATQDTIGICATNCSSSSTAPPAVMEQSPCISEYESEGYLERRKLTSRQAQAKKGIFQRAKPVDLQTLRSKPSRGTKKKVVIEATPIDSDNEEDNVPIVTLVSNDKLNVIADVAATVSVPEGDACVGLDVARDFGGEHGVCLGTIVRVDMHRRRALYHVVYTDGDEEDYDTAELQYAREFFLAHSLGTLPPTAATEATGLNSHFKQLFLQLLTSNIESVKVVKATEAQSIFLFVKKGLLKPIINVLPKKTN